MATSPKAQAAAAHHASHAAHDDDHGGDHGGGDHGGGHCPPPWILTFADMVTLLMAFFVMLLMTSKPDTPKFNAFASSMRQTFGRTPLVPTQELPGGNSILDLNWGPQSGPATTEPPSNTPKAGESAPEYDPQSGVPGATGDPVTGAASATAAGEALGKILQQAMAKGEINVQSDAGTVTVRLPSGATPENAKALADALAQAAGTKATQAPADQAGTGQAAGQTAGQGGTAASAADPGTGAGSGAGQVSNSGGQAQGGNAGDPAGTANDGDGSGAAVARKAEVTEAKLKTALEKELGEGMVKVEQRDGKVFVTLGSGGAFSSGSADMTAEARQIMDRVALATASGDSSITVTGHTDNVPVTGSAYGDNVGLAAARASSVVRELVASGVIDAKRVTAVSRGDSDPIADNATEEGRAKNRRIEIEVNFNGN